MLPNNPPQSFPILQSASCGSVGNCSAVGGYETANHPGLRKHALLVDESNGKWGAAFDAQLPPDAATAVNPNQTLDLGGSLRFVSCPSPGNCSAVGSYTRKDSTDSMLGFQGWLLDESGGNWGVGISAQLPADARTTVDSRGGESPFMGFTGLSCPSIGNCTAVGGYVDKHGAEQGVILTERKGRWSRGIRAQIPPREIAANPPNSLNSPLTSLSCAASNDCAAIGWYYDKSRRLHGLLLSERAGKWKASGLVLHAKAPGGIFLNSVDCGSRGNCVAIGYWGSHGKTYGLTVAERGGKWGRGIKAVLPRGAAASNKAHTFLNAVSCSAARRCTAVGSYTDRSGANQGLILSLRFR